VYFGFDLKRICNRKFLEVRWMECDEFALEERKLLNEYKRRTGDIPPGNRKLEPYALPHTAIPPVGADLEET
jgi:hypothetical protein